MRLLSRGIDVSVPDDSGYTAFMYACGQGHERIVSLMIKDGGVDVNDTSSRMLPLILATNKCHVDVVQLLIDNGARVDVRDETNRTPLLIACEKDCTSCVNTSLQNNDRMTALAIARSRRHFNVVDVIAKK